MLVAYLVPSLTFFAAVRRASTIVTMRAAQFSPGGPENLSLGQAPMPVLKQGQVLLKVMATAINRADTLQRKGLYPPPAGESEILGLEAAGLIHEKHKDASGPYKVGERVMALVPGGGNAQYVAVQEEHLMRVPEGLSFTEAAAIPEVWLTAFQLLTFVGNFKAGSTVLVHAGASGVGTAAVQIIKALGGSSIVTAGSEEKISFTKTLGATGGVNYKEGPFTDKVMELTAGKGVNMILDCVGGSHWEQNTAVIAMEGEWILYGLMGGSKVNGDILAKILRKRVALKGSTLRTRSNEYKASLIKSFSDVMLPHFSSQSVKPIIHRTMDLSQISEAHTLMETNTTIGKIVLAVTHSKDEL